MGDFMKIDMNNVKLELVESDDELSEYKLKDKEGKVLTSFSVEWNKTNALISYETSEDCRNQGYASLGLNMLKQELFSTKHALTLELINLSNDYSRKVAENAGFFSPSGSIDYYVTINPAAEEIIESQLLRVQADSTSYTRLQKLLNRIRSLKKAQKNDKLKKQEKLEALRRDIEIADNEDYKEGLMREITHLEGILNPDGNRDDNDER